MCERCHQDYPAEYLIQSEIIYLHVCSGCAREALRLMSLGQFLEGKLVRVEPLHKATQIY